MAGRRLPRLTEAQLELMDIVWRRGEATVTEVWEALPESRRGARTTVMTVLGRLADKGWLHRRTVGNEHSYRAAVPRDRAMGGLLSRLVDLAFGGSTENLVQTLFDARGLSREEAGRLRRIIDDLEGDRR